MGEITVIPEYRVEIVKEPPTSIMAALDTSKPKFLVERGERVVRSSCQNITRSFILNSGHEIQE